MEETKDTYKTISSASNEVLFKDRNSKFFGYAYPVSDEEQIKEHLEELKKKHHSARHWCYAWQLGKETYHYRANDDGEPSNSAGMPIYGQIQAYDVTNILIVVVRYFGGTKLGVGGLINAYRSAAQLALEESNIVERTIDRQLEISFEYPEMNRVMRVIKENNLEVVRQELELDCKLYLSVRKGEAEAILGKFQSMHKIKVKSIDEE